MNFPPDSPSAIALSIPHGEMHAESALIERVRAEDPDAIATLYDLHHASVRAFARHLVGDPMIAEDLVHEAFVSLPRAMRSFRGESSVRTLLIGIAVQHAKHHVRAAARRRAMLSKLAFEAYDAPEIPSDVAERKELAAALASALDALPMEQRVAFVLAEVEERPAKEIGAIVGAPEATIRTRLMHAKIKLRDLLSKRGVR